MKYELDTYYITVYENFTGADGKPSLYNRMFGKGYFTYELYSGNEIVTKSLLKEKLETILVSFIHLKGFTVSETEKGWKYERFVKWLDEDGYEYEIVEKGKHTDHEVYTVEISYIQEVTDIFQSLK